MRHHPNHRADIPVSLEVYHQLLGAASNTGFEKEYWEIAAEAIDEWVRRHNPDAIALPATKGYQWKGLFLPDGTLLRTVFDGKNHHCLVENDSILYNGQAVSPSGFVNAVGGVRRNAWRCTWILRPDHQEWELADTLRRRERPRRTRNTAIAPQPAAARAGDGGAPANAPAAAGPGPLPARPEPSAAGAPEVPCAQPSSTDIGYARVSIREGDSSPMRGSAPQALPRCSCGADRRTSGDGWMGPVLREELRQLLDRMSAFDAERRQTRTWPSAPVRPN